jgi:processive 1,2-diacylglycerol beta-glucosyltransferase
MNARASRSTVLLLYVSIGDGHRRAARAIEEAIRIHHPDLRALSFDLFDLYNRRLVSLALRAYRRLSRSFPRLWNRLYDNDRVRGRLGNPLARLYRRASGRLEGLYRESSPAVIVCTQAIPCGLAAAWKRSTGREIPLVAVPTDYAVHSYWIHEEVDLYLVPSEGNRASLLERGVAADKIRVGGIPIHPGFSSPSDPVETRRRFGLAADSPAILFMGGGEGTAGLEELIREIDRRREQFQMIAAAGRNRFLRRRLLGLRGGLRHPLSVFGFIESIDDLMGAADIIVTKPGGLTTAEALARRLPMILVNPLPGQEEINAAFLESRGAALRAGSGREAAALVGMALNGSGARERMRTAMEALRRPESARVSANLVAELIRS